MHFSLEKTKRQQNEFNKKSDLKFNWLITLPWEALGFCPPKDFDHETLMCLQEAVGSTPDGLIGRDTLHRAQNTLKDKGFIWNPFNGQVSELSTATQYVLWNGVEVPIFNTEYKIKTYKESEGIDLHSSGNFSKRDRDIDKVIVHWGGLNPTHLGRIFSNRKASSHFAVGRAEGSSEVCIFQYLDLAHIAWHAKGANTSSIGVDICQQPELKHLGYYVKNGYDVQTVDNPYFAEGYGPERVVSLDPTIKNCTATLLAGLTEAFDIEVWAPPVCRPYEWLNVSKDSTPSELKSAYYSFGRSGIYSHLNVDFAGQGKWDVAPWWDAIFKEDILDLKELNQKRHGRRMSRNKSTLL